MSLMLQKCHYMTCILFQYKFLKEIKNKKEIILPDLIGENIIHDFTKE